MTPHRQIMKLSLVYAAIGVALFAMAPKPARAMKASDYFEPGPQRALAEAAGKGDTGAMGNLLLQGAKIDFQGKEGMTALIWALLQENKKAYEYLLGKGANPNLLMAESTLTSDGVTDGNSAVSLAAMHEDPWYLEVTLKHKGDPNIVNPVKGTPVIFQCIMLLDHSRPKPRLEQLKLLIAAGVNLNARNKSDLTPLMYAVSLSRYDMAHLMLEAGADPGQKTKWGTTVVYEINESRTDPKSPLYQWRTKVIDLLKAKGVNVEVGR